MSARAKDSIYGILIIFAVLVSMSAFAQYGQDIDHHRVGSTETNTPTDTTTTVTTTEKTREVATAKSRDETTRMKNITNQIKSQSNE